MESNSKRGWEGCGVLEAWEDGPAYRTGKHLTIKCRSLGAGFSKNCIPLLVVKFCIRLYEVDLPFEFVDKI